MNLTEQKSLLEQEVRERLNLDTLPEENSEEWELFINELFNQDPALATKYERLLELEQEHAQANTPKEPSGPTTQREGFNMKVWWRQFKELLVKTSLYRMDVQGKLVLDKNKGFWYFAGITGLCFILFVGFANLKPKPKSGGILADATNGLNTKNGEETPPIVPAEDEAGALPEAPLTHNSQDPNTTSTTELPENSNAVTTQTPMPTTMLDRQTPPAAFQNQAPTVNMPDPNYTSYDSGFASNQPIVLDSPPTPIKVSGNSTLPKPKPSSSTSSTPNTFSDFSFLPNTTNTGKTGSGSPTAFTPFGTGESNTSSTPTTPSLSTFGSDSTANPQADKGNNNAPQNALVYQKKAAEKTNAFMYRNPTQVASSKQNRAQNAGQTSGNVPNDSGQQSTKGFLPESAIMFSSKTPTTSTPQNSNKQTQKTELPASAFVYSTKGKTTPQNQQAPAQSNAPMQNQTAVMYQRTVQNNQLAATPQAQNSDPKTLQSQNAFVYQNNTQNTPASSKTSGPQTPVAESGFVYNANAAKKGTSTQKASSGMVYVKGQKQNSVNQTSTAAYPTKTASPATGTNQSNVQTLAQTIQQDSQFAPSSIIEAKLVTAIDTPMGRALPVIAESSDGNKWIGTATLNASLGRVEIQFTRVITKDQVIGIDGTAFSPDYSIGIPAQVTDIAPNLVNDLLRSGAASLNTYVQNLATSGTTSIGVGGTVTTNKTAVPLTSIMLGEMGKVFTLPENTQTFVRMGHVDRGTAILIIMGLGQDK